MGRHVLEELHPGTTHRPGLRAVRAGVVVGDGEGGRRGHLPAGPVDITRVSPSGSEPFEATFTAEEITALLNVYRYTADLTGSPCRSRARRAAFPKPGVGALGGTLSAGGSNYAAEIEGPVDLHGDGPRQPRRDVAHGRGVQRGGRAAPAGLGRGHRVPEPLPARRTWSHHRGRPDRGRRCLREGLGSDPPRAPGSFGAVSRAHGATAPDAPSPTPCSRPSGASSRCPRRPRRPRPWARRCRRSSSSSPRRPSRR